MATRYRSRRRSSTSSGSGGLGGLFRLWKTASENADALDALKVAYQRRESLSGILAAYARATGSKADDAAIAAVLNLVQEAFEGAVKVSDAMIGVGDAADGIGDTFGNIAGILARLNSEPLIEIIEGGDDGEEDSS